MHSAPEMPDRACVIARAFSIFLCVPTADWRDFHGVADCQIESCTMPSSTWLGAASGLTTTSSTDYT